ncbi:hypothetical protein Tco_1197828, partial [Tanacetum coccineum]
IREVWASCNPSTKECDRGSSRNNEVRCYWKSENDNDRTNVEWNDLIDYDDNNDFYDPDQCVDGRNNEIRERIIHNLHEEWFKWTFDKEDDIEGIICYLEPTSCDGFIDLDEEEYNKRRRRLLGMPYVEPLPIIIEQVKNTRYSLGPREVYTKLEASNTKELPRTRNNVATIRSNIMEEVFENYEDEMM